jgi:hypothetical protein
MKQFVMIASLLVATTAFANDPAGHGTTAPSSATAPSDPTTPATPGEKHSKKMKKHKGSEGKEHPSVNKPSDEHAGH